MFPEPSSPPQSADQLVFADESIPEYSSDFDDRQVWKIMMVDDEPSVHQATKVALKFFTFENRQLEFISAYSAEEAKQLIASNPDTVLILLDVIMRTQDAGLKVAQYVREELKNKTVRIVLRTGQPGQVPEESVVVNYDINDYKTKLELTQEKLFTTLVASIRAYRDLKALEESQTQLSLLNAELQRFNQTLEQQVRDRTQALTYEIEEREKAEESLKIYIHALTHDLRNPVVGMTNVLERFLARGRQGDASLAQIPVSVLARMRAGCDRQLKMINSLIETQEIEIWGVALERQPLSLGALTEDVIEAWQLRTAKKRLTVNLHLSDNVPLVEGDRTQLWRVVENFIDNVLKYNPPGRTLQIRVLSSSGWVRCELSDDGVGISPEQAEHIFERYHRGRAARPTQGLGLGLYICRQIVEAHGGRIGVRSELGEGTLFWFELPATTPGKIER
ncbi:MAG: hybrid sensor histidine kinase/response regulator [Cyanobacteria bacterium J06623_4]